MSETSKTIISLLVTIGFWLLMVLVLYWPHIALGIVGGMLFVFISTFIIAITYNALGDDTE